VTNENSWPDCGALRSQYPLTFGIELIMPRWSVSELGENFAVYNVKFSVFPSPT
jgi:hypothetical protein